MSDHICIGLLVVVRTWAKFANCCLAILSVGLSVFPVMHVHVDVLAFFIFLHHHAKGNCDSSNGGTHLGNTGGATGRGQANARGVATVVGADLVDGTYQLGDPGDGNGIGTDFGTSSIRVENRSPGDGAGGFLGTFEEYLSGVFVGTLIALGDALSVGIVLALVTCGFVVEPAGFVFQAHVVHGLVGGGGVALNLANDGPSAAVEDAVARIGLGDAAPDEGTASGDLLDDLEVGS